MNPSRFHPLIVGPAGPSTRVLLVHAPYPGAIKFDSHPSSLLTAAAPLADRLACEGRLGELGILDPRGATDAFYGELEGLLATGTVEVVCISSSTAAIQEAARIATLAREASPRPLLVIGGGPHEDDIDEPMASRLPAFDFSVAGDGEQVLASLVMEALEGGGPARIDVAATLAGCELLGRGKISGPKDECFTWNSTTPAPVDAVLTRPWTERTVVFDVFGGRPTLPLMVSRGCSYGQCTFCAEASGGRQRLVSDFAPLAGLIEAFPEHALYFQDSIFPAGQMVREELLPLLQASGREWGCQVYLPSLSQRFITLLAEHGCTYVYTGVESSSEELRTAVGKRGLRDSVLHQRLGWIRDSGMRVGISLMFGAMDSSGELLETRSTVAGTLEFARRVVESGVEVTGFYPNVLTVLPGTSLARSLAQAGRSLDFYVPPRQLTLDGFEDGGVGWTADLKALTEVGVDEAVLYLSTAPLRRCAAMPSRQSS